jgi:RNA polymerase sigma factor (sigma-70 family)
MSINIQQLIPKSASRFASRVREAPPVGNRGCAPVKPSYLYRLGSTEHLHRIGQIARKQTRGTKVDWQDALQTAQLKLVTAINAGKFISGTEQDFDRWAATVARCEIIDLVRKAKHHGWESTDRQCGTERTLLDTIPDPTIDPLTSLERGELIARVRQTIVTLDRLYPARGYYRLWLAKVNDRTQTEIALELGLTQGAVSKRWKELLAKLLLELGLDDRSSSDRTRSHQQW